MQHPGLSDSQGALAKQKPKTPLTAAATSGLVRGFFPSRERSEGSSQSGIALEKNMNYLSVTSGLV